MKRQTIATAFAAVAFGAIAVNPLWVRDLKLSPDGTKLAFGYKGSIYTVPASGGEARRLTDAGQYAGSPVWSPDGKKIAYSSDRNGGTDIYLMSADGSNQTRLTFNSTGETPETFSPDGKELYFSAVIQDPASSALGVSRVNSELYSVPISGGRISQIMAIPAVNVETLPGSDNLVFEVVKGLEDKWRKHHTSSVTRDIWSWSPASGKFTNLTSKAGEDREPAPSPDGKTLYFLSERNGGSMNVWEMPATGGEAKAVTSFKDHPVRFLSAAPGMIAFTWNGEAYTMKEGNKPRKVAIEVVDTESEGETLLGVNSAHESSVSPDGTQVAFTNRGEVFVTSVKYPSIKQITHTPAMESDLTWGKDGRSLYYTSRRRGIPNIYVAKIARNDDPNFSNATIVTEEALFPEDGVERTGGEVSPDGKKLLYTEGRSKVKVMDLASKKTRTLMEHPTNYRTSGFGGVWSPDSKWVAMDVMNPLHEPYGDVSIVSVETGEVIPVTQTAYFDESPRWRNDGQALIFGTDRFGMRSHGSWGSQQDVMMVFLTKDAYDRFRLSEEDFALLKDVEKEQKKNAAKKEGSSADVKKGSKKDAGKESGKDKKKDEGRDSKASEGDASKQKEEVLVKIDRDGLQDRIVRLTPNSSNLGDAVLSKDGETLYYLASFEGGYDLWKKDLRKGTVSMASKLGSGAVRIQTDKDGNMYLLGSNIRKYTPGSNKIENVSIAGKMKIDRAKEREAMLDFVETEARERFYLPKMPVDWKKYVADYRRFLPHINNNKDFADLLSELLGELNVSHSGGRFYGAGAKEATASLGLLYDLNADGDGLVVAEVLEGGPFDRATSKVRPGHIVTSINDTYLKAGEDWTAAFNDIARKKTLVGIADPKTGEKWGEVVLPITQNAESGLLYDRWVKGRERDVENLSNGRLGYVHIKSMDDESFRKVYSKLLGEYVDKEGIVIDTRWNGGGRLHEDIEVLFSGEKYLTQEIHGRKSSEMPSRRWNKPSIMVIGEANYSNAHGTPWVYKHKKMGKLVGMPVPGTMSSVNWITLQDPSLVFGVPVVAFRTEDGTILENTQLEPDVMVENLPADIVSGRDAQIEAAVKELLKEIDGK